MDTNELISLRHRLHQCAELSHEERKTQDILEYYLQAYGPTSIQRFCDDKALLASFESGKPGPRIMFRADLDALPIPETLDLSYGSVNKGSSHKCGHDGHMSLVASLASVWPKISHLGGKLGLLFQHAEELGEGAKELVQDASFQSWQADQIYGFHNLPGVAENKVLIAQGETFASASCGLKLSFFGSSSHAAEPEHARTPVSVMIEILQYCLKHQTPSNDGVLDLLTPVGIKMGAENYGVTPGDGELYLTLRSHCDLTLDRRKNELIALASQGAQGNGLTMDYEVKEHFPSLKVDPQLSKLVATTAKENGFQIESVLPFRWSEDFGHFEKTSKICYFGLGMGVATYPLHDPRYDFNDRTLEPYHQFLAKLVEACFSNKEKINKDVLK